MCWGCTWQFGAKLWLHMSISGSWAAGWSGPLTLKALDVLIARAQPE
jgi:hypothetical protein